MRALEKGPELVPPEFCFAAAVSVCEITPILWPLDATVKQIVYFKAVLSTLMIRYYILSFLA